MSSRKLDFKTWCNDIGIRECYQKTECDDCKASWSFCEAQEKREYELLESEHSELLANFCKVDMERLRLEREVVRLKEENLKMRNCENCIHYDIVTECELTAITCTNYNKWEIRK